MFAQKVISRILSVLLVTVFFFTGKTSAQTAQAAPSLSASDWAQVTALMPDADATDIIHQADLSASNPEDNNSFGRFIALDGNTLVVAAPRLMLTISDYDPSNSGYGAVYVFVRNGPIWIQQAYLKASSDQKEYHFGISVSIHGDTLAVGSYYISPPIPNNTGGMAGVGSVYIFTRTDGVWTEQAHLNASNPESGDRFGSSISLFEDTLVVGAIGEDSNATGINGDQADNSALDSGAVYVFTRTGETWTQQAYIKDSYSNIGGYFGASVSLTNDTLVVGAPDEEHYESDGSIAFAGVVYVFTRTGMTWSQQAHLEVPSQFMVDGTTFKNGFGHSVSISGDTLVVGVPGDCSDADGVNGDQTNCSVPFSGAAYVFTRSGTTWSQQAYIKASNSEGITIGDSTGYFFVGDAFGSSVSISGNTLLIGAPNEASNATGVNGDQTDNSVLGAGAVYIFTRNGTTWRQEAYLKPSSSKAQYGFGISTAISGNTFMIGSWDSAGTGSLGAAGTGSLGAAAVYRVPSLAFTDIPFAYWANNHIESLYRAGLTGGCGAGAYCPEASVTRAQMAVFIEKGLHGSDFNPPTAAGTKFIDVSSSHWAASWIEALTTDGITSGCGNGNYCPDQTVTRAQIAVFLLKAKYGSSYTPPAVGVSTGFNDVATNYWAAAFIKQLVADSITSGCGSNNYCPDSNVTRAQMAVFLVKTFNLP